MICLWIVFSSYESGSCGICDSTCNSSTQFTLWTTWVDLSVALPTPCVWCVVWWFQFFHPIHLMDNLSRPECRLANSLCLMCRPCGADIFSAGYQSGLLIWSPHTGAQHGRHCIFWSRAAHEKVVAGERGFVANCKRMMLKPWWLPQNARLTANKPGNFCRVAGVRLLFKELASFPGKT